MAEDEEFQPLRKSIKRKETGIEDNFMLPYGHEHDQTRLNSSELTEHEIEKIRYNHSIEVDDEKCPLPIRSFQEANLPHSILTYLNNCHVYSPTAVQMQSIPILLSGKDLISIAPTGSGKTLSYLLPLCAFLTRRVERSCLKPGSPTALIITPTRELMQQVFTATEAILQAMQGNETYRLDSNYGNQVYNQEDLPAISQYGPVYYNHGTVPPRTLGDASFNGLSQYDSGHPGFPCNQNDLRPNNQIKYSAFGICGGQPFKVHVERLKASVDVIVATPGRLLELSQKNFIDLGNVSYFVLDECDKMLDMGLEEQLRKLIAIITVHDIPRQTSLWSATLPDSLERLARSSVLNPITIHVGLKDTVCRNIEQDIIFMHTYQRSKKLLQALRTTQQPPVLVFVSSASTVDEVVELLKEEEFVVEGLHSKKSQDQRFKAVSDFRDGTVDVLVATDLASRGLDIPEITHVINYETPNTIEDYIHRCGRTGRYGRTGHATTFLTLACKIADELKQLLESSGIPIPKALEDTKQFGKKVLITEFGDRLM